MPCRHPDIRKYKRIRCCLACGEALLEDVATSEPATSIGPEEEGTERRYQYRRLNFKLGEDIRLVNVQPGTGRDPIVCEIIHVNLGDEPEYEAMSYTWATEQGDADTSQHISCVDGGTIAITVNCEAALRQLRTTSFHRCIWIDAICIDQLNVQERNRQVALMDSIFAQAKRVLVCINNPNYSYTSLFALLRTGTIDALETRARISTELGHFLGSRYFQRVWIIQEIALAKEVVLFVNGDALLLSFSILERLWDQCTSHKIEVPFILRYVPGDGGSRLLNISSWLRITVRCKATDLRDRVYAILSLLDPVSRSIIPIDYALSVESVYTNALIAVIAHYQDLLVLSFAKPDSDADWLTSPSLSMKQMDDYFAFLELSPDQRSTGYNGNFDFEGTAQGPWRSKVCLEVTNQLQEGIEGQDIAADSSLIAELANDLQLTPHSGLLPRLRVRAHYIDQMVHSWRDSSHSAVEFSDVTLLDDLRRPFTDVTWILPFFRQTCQERSKECSLGSPRELRLSVPEEIDAEGYDVQDLRRFLREAWSWKTSTSSNLPERTETSRMFQGCHSVGIAICGFEEGDEVFAIDGARTLFVLRKTSEHHYRIINDCYYWAAFELNYWNPGSKKGLWGARRHGHGREQTRMIEIC